MDYFWNSTLIGPMLFLLTALVFGLFKPKYRPLHNTISESALGRYGYIQTANYIVSGLLITLLGVHLVAAHTYLCGAVSVIILGLVLLFSAIFRTDPITAKESTPTGRVHNALFFVGLLGIVSAQFVTGFAVSGSALGVFSLTCGVLTAIGMAVTVTRQTYMGLFQRALVLVVVLWVTVFAFSTLGG